MENRTNVSGGVLADPQLFNSLRPGMRIVLDEMREDPYPVDAGMQGTVTSRDDSGDVQMRWDNGSGLKLLDIDSFHVVSGEDELAVSFEYLKKQQEKGYNSCPRCGTTFDVRRGAVSRRIRKLNIAICDLCGQQEAVEDFISYGHKHDAEVKVFVPEEKNQTGYDLTEETGDDGRRIDVKIKPLTDWHQVKLWQGRAEQ